MAKKKTAKKPNMQDSPMNYYRALRRDHERLRKVVIALRKLLAHRYGIHITGRS